MNSRWLVVVVVASLALNIAVVGSFLFARVRAPHRPPRFDRPLPGLRGEHVSALRQLRKQFRPKMDSLRVQAEEARAALTELAAEPNPDPKAVDSLLTEIGRFEMQMNRLAFEHARQIGERLPTGVRGEFFQRLREHHRGPMPGLMMRRGRHRRQPGLPEPNDFDDTNP